MRHVLPQYLCDMRRHGHVTYTGISLRATYNKPLVNYRRCPSYAKCHPVAFAVDILAAQLDQLAKP